MTRVLGWLAALGLLAGLAAGFGYAPREAVQGNVQRSHDVTGVITASRDSPLPEEPLIPTLTSDVVPSTVSRKKISPTPFVSLSARSGASLSKRTYRPSAETPHGHESPFPPPVPVKFTLTSEVVLLVWSTKNTFSFAGK